MWNIYSQNGVQRHRKYLKEGKRCEVGSNMDPKFQKVKKRG